MLFLTESVMFHRARSKKVIQCLKEKPFYNVLEKNSNKSFAAKKACKI